MKTYKKILVIGSGPIIIGQGAEFDYSGTQACNVLKEEGIETVLVNSNPATIMTDQTVADKVYMEPLTTAFLTKIIEKERPDALIPGMGGQTALNLAMSLWKEGVLDQFDVEVLGTSLEAIEEAEDRDLFKSAMERIQQPVMESRTASSVEEAVAIGLEIGLPVVVRPAFTLGGTGGGIVETVEELKDIAEKGIEFSIADQVLIEKSIKGWKEIEYEMMRDAKGTTIAVCNMENIDPVGIHTGDSIVVAPSQTLNDHEYQMLRTASIEIVDALQIQGGCNVQLALNPSSKEYYIIEVNPRVSRSSSLASKATGYPIAKVATKIALGYHLDQIENDITGKTKACFEPALDYCVVKIPKWPFDKFKEANASLGTMMMATGEVMAIGNTFESALLKAIRSCEDGRESLRWDYAAKMTLDHLFIQLDKADHQRIFYLAELMRRQVGIPKLQALTGIEWYFLNKIKGILLLEATIKDRMLDFVEPSTMALLKQKGFSDQTIASLLLGVKASDVRQCRLSHGIQPAYKMVDTCGAEFEAQSPYYYSTYDQEDEVVQLEGDKVVVIGSGPIRIGQGVEFDYCSVHGVKALKDAGYRGFIINNNPETVSTDFDVSDSLFFEPITAEDVLNVVDRIGAKGVILQFGGQTAVKLAKAMEENGVTILGTSFDAIDQTEDRDRFIQGMDDLGLPYPKGRAIRSLEEGLVAAGDLGYPLMVRPSYVIGGLGMEIVHEVGELTKYIQNALEEDQDQTILIDQYLYGTEVEVDAVSDGEDVLIPGIMEHLEAAGVHSGDSISIYPPVHLSQDQKDQIYQITRAVAKGFGLVGVLNIQFVIQEGKLFVLEVNPRASRTVPFISKVTDLPVIAIATEVMLGKTLSELPYGCGLHPEPSFYAVKHPVFSMEKILEAEVALGPEMKSTGEILSMDLSLDHALYKGFTASLGRPLVGKTLLVSLPDASKEDFGAEALALSATGYKLMATPGTYAALHKHGVHPDHMIMVQRTYEGINEALKSPDLAMVFTVPTKGKVTDTLGFQLRRMAFERKVPCLTSMDTIRALSGLLAKDLKQENMSVYALDEKSSLTSN